MKRAKLISLLALTLISASCAKPGSGSSPAPSSAIKTGGGGPGGSSAQGERQIGEGTTTCPFAVDPAAYEIKVPISTKLLGSVQPGRYLLTEIHTHRSTLTTPETAVFSNALKIILKEPGRIGTTDTTQVLIQDTGTPLTAGNLSFPLSFEAKKGSPIAWGRFATYEPKIETGAQLSIGTPVIKEFDEKVLMENAGRYSFNVFARHRLSGYQIVVKLNKSDFGFIKGLVVLSSDEVRFVVSMPRGSASTDVAESTYELVFKSEEKAKAPDCGANASALKVLGSSSN